MAGFEFQTLHARKQYQVNDDDDADDNRVEEP